MQRKILLVFTFLLVFKNLSFSQSTLNLLKDTGFDINETASVNGRFFFTKFGPLDLWVSDGTTAGTLPVGSPAIQAKELYVMNQTLFFAALVPGYRGFKLCKYNSASLTYEVIKDISSEYYGPRGFYQFNNTLYFSADDGVHGGELWKSDGTEAGTVMVKDIFPGSASGGFSQPVILNNVMYFRASDDIHGASLWKSDGTNEGTVFVKDFNLASNLVGGVNLLAVVNNILYFTVDDGIHGVELWKSDGTDSGSSLLKDFVEGAESGANQLDGVTSINDKLLILNKGLWVSDGTTSGTKLIKPIEGSGFFKYNSQIYFTYSANLWTTDGTTEGTLLAMDRTFSYGSLINNVYYSLENKSPLLTGFNIVKSELTDCKTKTVFSSTGSIPFFDKFLAVGNKLYISARTSAGGSYALFTYDTSIDPAFNCTQQTLSFNPLPPQVYGGSVDLNATTSSGLPITYSLSDTALGILTGNKVTFTGVGTLTITASQSGNDSFDRAVPISRSFAINKANQLITFPTIPAQETVSTLPLQATSSSGLPVTYSTTTPNKITFFSGSIGFNTPGKVNLTANQDGNAYYNSAIPITQEFCVKPIQPIITSDGKPETTLTSSSSSGNQWFRDGASIIGATSTSYKPTLTGSYTLQVTIEGCSSELSLPISLIITGLEQPSMGIEAYPNPFDNELTIHLDGENAEIRIKDLFNRTILTKQSSNLFDILDVTTVPSGIYFIEVKTSLQTKIERLVKK